ncbi:MAG: HEAT repeat domain-containing protein [Pyrinomonadaceae bacterium]
MNSTVGSSSSSEVDLTIHALKDFLSGGSTPPPIPDSNAAYVRPLVAAELLAAITGSDAPAGSQDYPTSSFDHQDRGEPGPVGDHSSGHQKEERARQLFIDYGYLDQAINSLRSNESPEERAEAARTLGIIGSERGTAPLVAALFDDAPQVREAAEKALGNIGDPSVSIGPISTLISSEMDYGGPYVVGPSDTEATPVEESKITSVGEVGTNVEIGGKSSLQQLTVDNAVAKTSPALKELDQIRKDIVELERLLVEAVAARKEADKEVLVRAEQESAFRAEVAVRRREDEEVRRRAEEKAARRRSEDDRKMAAEQLGRHQAELEAQRFAEEEERLRREVGSLMQTSGEITRERAEVDASEFATAAEARRLEAEDSLRIAKERYHAELKRLRDEEEELHRSTEEATAQRIGVEVLRREAEAQARRLAGEKQQLAESIAALDAEAQLLCESEAKARVEHEKIHQQVEAVLRVNEDISTRRAEIEAQKQKAFNEVERLKEAQERTQAAERIRREAETERSQREEELSQQVEREQRLLAEIRHRAEAEQQRVEEASRLRAEEQDRRLAELEALRAEMEIVSQQRTAKEHRLNSEVEGLRAGEREALTRIDQAESLRKRAGETLHVAAEKIQRIEAEARRSAMEDQRVLDKLEETRRNLDLGAQARADQ